MPTHKQIQRQQWIDAATPRLGKESDEDIAKDLGRTARQVRYLRQKLGIEPLHKARWDYAVLRRLGTESYKKLAQELGVSPSTVQAKRSIHEPKYERHGMPPEAVPLLGKLTDMEIAVRFGRSVSTASMWRVAQGFKAPKVRRPWTPGEIAKLGTMPDKTLARVLVRRPRDVRNKREALDIAPYPQRAENGTRT